MWSPTTTMDMDATQSQSSELNIVNRKRKFANIDLSALPDIEKEDFFNILDLSDDEAFIHYQRVDQSYYGKPAMCPFCRCQVDNAVLMGHVEQCLNRKSELYSRILFHTKKIKIGTLFCFCHCY